MDDGRATMDDGRSAPPRLPRVLVADDYPGMVAAIQRFLSTDCDVVGAVGDGEALIEAATALRPDVVVVDLNLPKVNGLEACERIKQVNPEIKVILLSGMSGVVNADKARASGASAFVTKFAIGEELITAIKNACAES